MRICVNVLKEGLPRICEEDIEIALQSLWPSWARDWEITEQGDGCFTADVSGPIGQRKGFETDIAKAIKHETGAIVNVESFEGWPPPGWSP